MTPEELAERATLGTLLLEPARIPDVRGWLRAEDFGNRWNADAYLGLCELAVARQSVDATMLAERLKDRRGARGAELHRVQTVLAATPLRPDASTYGRMVLEASIRRQLPSLGVLLRAGGMAAARDAEPGKAAPAAGLAHDAVVAAERRWAVARRVRRADASIHRASDGAALGTDVERAVLAAARFVSAHTDQGSDAITVQRRLVGALIQQAPAEWDVPLLPAAALTDPRAKSAYDSIVDLAQRGSPVDVITVAWAMREHGQWRNPVDDLQGFVRDAGTTPVAALTRRVLASATARQAEETAAGIASTARDHRLPVSDVLQRGREGIDRLQALAVPASTLDRPSGLRRLHQAQPRRRGPEVA